MSTPKRAEIIRLYPIGFALNTFRMEHATFKESKAFEELLQSVGVANLVAGIRREIVNAGIADELLEEGQGVVVESHGPQG